MFTWSHQARVRSLTTSIVLSLLLFLSFSVGVEVAFADSAPGSATAVTQAATVRSRVVFSEQQPGEKQGVWLAGFSSLPGEAPTALSVTFSQVAAGWLGPLWGLQLQSDVGILPARLNPQPGSDFLDGSEFILLQSLTPKWGHAYEIELGYDPVTGAATVQLINLTEQRTVFTRNLQLNSYEAPLYPGAGVGQVTDAGTVVPQTPMATISSVELMDYLLPVRVSWWIMQREDADQSYLTALQIDRRHETAFRVHLTWEELQPDVRLRILDSGGAELLLIPYDYVLDYTPVPSNILAPGTYTAILEYSFGERTWELDRRTFSVGVIEIEVARLEAVRTSGNTIVLDGLLRINGDGPLQDVAIGLDASVVNHTFSYDATATRGTMAQQVGESTTVFGPMEIATDAQSELEFTAQLEVMGTEDPSSFWEVRLEPFSYPDTFFAPGAQYHTWVGQEPPVATWQGFLSNETHSRLQLAPGVEVVSLTGRIGAGPLRIQLVIADLTVPGVRVDALVGSALTTPATSRWPRSQMSQMVTAAGAIAGVNSAFFDISNTMNPLGIVMRSGDLLKTEMGGQAAAIGVDIHGKPYLGYWQWAGGVQRPDGSEYRPVTGVNVTSPGIGLVLYRSPAMQSQGTTNPDSPITELVLSMLPERDVIAAPWNPAAVKAFRGVVQEVRHGQPGVPLRSGMMVLAGGGEYGEYLQSAFSVGDVVEIPYRLTGSTEWPYLGDWKDLHAAVSGGVVLLRNGGYGDGSVLTNTDRHPRTAVGISLDQSLLYVIVADGRSLTSVGMTYREMADFFRHIGAFHALNLDGGGSSALAVLDPRIDRVNVLNVPSDGPQRYVPDGLGIFYRDPFEIDALTY